MSYSAKGIIKGMEEVLAIVRGEAKPSRVHLVHVPAGSSKKRTRRALSAKRPARVRSR